ncbi:MAG: PRC-barrel domain-containing protein [Thermofilaceae archaeon]
MRVKNIIGKEVVTEDGVSIGRIEDLEIENWVVTKLVLRLSRDAARAIGVRFSLRPRGSVSLTHVKGVGDYVTLSVAASKLSDAVKLE